MKIKSFAKINIFLKIVGTSKDYHKIISRFVKIYTLFDEIEFIKEKNNSFFIEGSNIELQKNTIYKSYQLLRKYINDSKIENFFKNYKVKIKKQIPIGGGLGGGSSNAASFLKLTNEVLKLNLTKKELYDLGKRVGADVSFFIEDFPSANVSGIGEIVEYFEEDPIDLTIKTFKEECNTKKVYLHFRNHYLDTIEPKFAQKLSTMKSKDILQNYQPLQINDLYRSALKLYPFLKKFKKNWFLSGSGCSIYKKGLSYESNSYK